MKKSGLADMLAELTGKNEPVILHGKRVAKLACAIARDLKYPAIRIELISEAAVTHDIGKIRIPAELLYKPGSFDDAEFALIRQHPQFGYDLLKLAKAKPAVMLVALEHHERMDGSGYPSGLRGQEIITEARIIAVADVVETMASPQVYRPALAMNKVTREISGRSGTLYDPVAVEAALRVIKRGDIDFGD